MPKQPLTTTDAIALFLYGRRYDFYQPRLHANVSQTLPAGHFDGNAANPTRVQKHQIVLHCTTDHAAAEVTVAGWRRGGAGVGWASAHYVLERHSTTASAVRPAPQAGSHRNDESQADAVQLALEDAITFHAGSINRNSIGIEMANRAHGVNHGATDQNSFIELRRASGLRGGGTKFFEAYEDEQYATLIMLLRHLCIAHRIPRRFLGDTLEDALGQFLHSRVTPLPVPGRTFVPDTPEAVRTRAAELRHFRGILVHNQAHKNKTCPGIIHRNRIFRGIIDHFWLPVSIAGHGERNYYSGPFRKPPGDTTVALHHYARPSRQFVSTLYRNADIEKLYDCSHFFDVNQVDAYFAAVEQAAGGTFPIGRNQVWHGGVHFLPPSDYPAVFASASGVIVAARLSSNKLTDREPGFGSQRFILVQHAVSLCQQRDTSGTPAPQGHLGADPTRTDYTRVQYVYSLYMHLAPFADIAAENDENPPWFNLWRRANPSVTLRPCANNEAGQVFCPDTPVSIGDILGFAGSFAGQDHVLHFEVFTGQQTELGGNIGLWGQTPWESTGPGTGGVEDRDTNLQAGAALVSRLLPGTPLTPQNLRSLKTLHMSEWALSQESQLAKVIPDSAERRRQFPHRLRFSWIADAIAAARAHAAARSLAGGDLSAAEFFGGLDGLFWHYHPIVFMQHANRLVRQEAAEVIERDHAATAGINCLLSPDGYLERFVEFDAASGDYRDTSANASAVKPFDISTYSFSLLEISCNGPGQHAPNQSPPQRTHFAVCLLNVLEQIRAHFDAGIRVTAAHLCSAHSGTLSLCILNDAAHIAEHAQGLAVDITPSNPSVTSCQALVASATFVKARFDEDADEGAGNPGYGDFPAGVSQMVVEHPTVPASAAAARTFCVHVALRA